jgi:hypothetical protein
MLPTAIRTFSLHDLISSVVKGHPAETSTDVLAALVDEKIPDTERDDVFRQLIKNTVSSYLSRTSGPYPKAAASLPAASTKVKGKKKRAGIKAPPANENASAWQQVLSRKYNCGYGNWKSYGEMTVEDWQDRAERLAQRVNGLQANIVSCQAHAQALLDRGLTFTRELPEEEILKLLSSAPKDATEV